MDMLSQTGGIYVAIIGVIGGVGKFVNTNIYMRKMLGEL